MIISISILVIVVCGDDTSELGRPENNILTLKNRDHFTFSALNVYGGNLKYVADEQKSLTNTNWPRYGFQGNKGADGVAFRPVDTG